MPDDLAEQIRKEFEDDPTHSWDEALWSLTGLVGEDEDADS